MTIRFDATWNPDGKSQIIDEEEHVVDVLGRWETDDGRYYFNVAKAKKPGLFFRGYLRHTKGEFAGKPFDLLPWQALLIFEPLFGWCRSSDHLRRFRQVFVMVPKKCGKSAIASGLALLLATADGEPGAEVYSAAGDEGQARIVFDEASNMAEGSPEFLEDLGVEVLAGSITQGRSKSKYQVLTAKASTKHGFNVHGLVLDELHTQKTRDLIETLEKGVSARRQPVVFKITTAGDDRESICYEEYEVAKRVINGTSTNEQLLPVIFEASLDDDWTAEATWHKANPSLGVTKSLDYMRAECKGAMEEPRKRNAFLRLDLDIWTESRTVWIAPETWASCPTRPEPADLGTLTGCVGVDLSATRDLTAAVAVFRRRDTSLPVVEVEIDAPPADGVRSDAPVAKKTLRLDFVLELVPRFWLPADGLAARAKADGVPYDVWARDKWLNLTHATGGVVDYDPVLEEVLAMRKRWKGVQRIGVDPFNATHFNASLLATGAPVVEVRQGARSLSAACKLFEMLVASGRIRHDGNPIMRWCVANCEVESDHLGNIHPVKPGGDARSRRRIDGVAATITALSQLMLIDDRRPMARVGVIRF